MIDELEIIEIDKDHGKVVIHPRGVGDALLNAIPQQGPVGRGCKKFCVNGFWQETAALHGAMMTVEMKPLPTDLIDALLADYKKPECVFR